MSKSQATVTPTKPLLTTGSPSRRRFLLGSAVAGASTVLAGTLSTDVLAAETTTSTEPNHVLEPLSGYQLTPHIAAYYRSASR